MIRFVENSNYTEGINDKSIFKALIVIGGPGSGKSFIVEMFSNFIGAKILNSDKYFEAGLIKYTQSGTPYQQNILLKSMQKYRQKKAYLKKQDLKFKFKPEDIMSKTMQDYRNTIVPSQLTAQSKNWLNSMLPVVIDATGKDYNKIVQITLYLESIGYDVGAMMISTNIQKALLRNVDRERVIPEELVRKIWDSCLNNVSKFTSFFAKRFWREEANINDLDGRELFEKKTEIQKMASTFFLSPVKNPLGVTIIDYLKRNNKKYYVDFFDDFIKDSSDKLSNILS